MKYNFIAIEGNIGSGKTTLANRLANDLRARLLLEQFANNPFLPKFYKSPEENAFALELFFMAERYQQLKDHQEQDLFFPITVSDYFFVKSKLFAKNNLNLDEQKLFDRLFDIMVSFLPFPDIIIYLHADIYRLQANIKKRGRSFEKNISEKYLYDIQNRYLDYLSKQSKVPVLIVDITKVDFKENKIIYQEIKGLLNSSYHTGIHRFTL